MKPVKPIAWRKRAKPKQPDFLTLMGLMIDGTSRWFAERRKESDRLQKSGEVRALDPLSVHPFPEAASSRDAANPEPLQSVARLAQVARPAFDRGAD